MSAHSDQERLRRWRLILGSDSSDGIDHQFNQHDAELDRVLTQLYGRHKRNPNTHSGHGSGGTGQQTAPRNDPRQTKGRTDRGGLNESMPDVSRWLGDIRKYFPSSVVQLMQKDAVERIGLHQLLSEPDIVEMLEPDIHLVTTLLTLKDVIPGETKETARIIVRKVVDDLIQRLENPMREAIRGALNRAVRNRRPKHREINWLRTIHANLKHYQPTYKSVIPQQLIGYGRKHSATHDVIICIDQSASMASSMVYASIFGAVMASIPALNTRLIVFDTKVVDLTPYLDDPVDLLFGATLGGGTNINQALSYCHQLIQYPNETSLILISDLYEGGHYEQLIARVRRLLGLGVNMVGLLALSDQGTPAYDHRTAVDFSEMGMPVFACTPDLFPELMATTMNRRNLGNWATQRGIKTMRQQED
ncbi:MAG: VWA domain-containing protein [Anaerolineae bacterium]